ncbi:sulfotransferase [Pelagibius litoralis]|uniref:Sulfotransferase n=1 Tax=Pelagibius litoralis TaxID=374515 RepID=A0A967C989_9PROT|nr:sulfotransferase [Pelagibius litoralis]NIA69147.1 sulfotransferase [Pelagibius litoralis]
MKLLSGAGELRSLLNEVGVFVVTGVTKSGTTWLQRLLNSHPEVACGGESKLNVLLTHLTPAIREYNTVLTKTNQKIYKEQAVYDPLGREQLLAAMQYFFLDRLSAVQTGAAAAGKADALRWIGDKDPDYKRDLVSWRAILPEARIISTIRDGRDCYVSLWFHLYPEREPLAAENRADFLGRIKGHAATWRDTAAKFQKDAADYPGRHFSLQYERMLEDTAREMTALFDWLGCDTSEATIAEVVRRNSFQALSGGRNPGETDAKSFLRKGIAGDWKNHFDEECDTLYRDVAGEALAAAGYEA